MKGRRCTIAVIGAVLAMTLFGCLTKPIAGAYAPAARDDDAVVAAYAFLREKLAESRSEITLGKIRNAYRQVVAGYNIRLRCEYRMVGNARTRLLTAVVYFDLQGGQQLLEVVLD